jgi:hypothetical protein
MPSDVTVIEIHNGDFVFDDTAGKTRRGKQLIVPIVTIKAGEIIYPNRDLAEAESNWSMEGSIAYEGVPENASLLDNGQCKFLGELVPVFERLETWDGPSVHDAFHRTWQQSDIDLRQAAEAVFNSFMTSRFTPPVGFFLATQDRDFVLTRLRDLGCRPPASFVTRQSA